MIRLRRSHLHDLDGLMALAQQAKAGLTTLPPDAYVLQERLEAVERSFEHKATQPGSETYLFVLEDCETHRILGTCGIASKIGGYEPHWTYELKTQDFVSESLNTQKSIEFLQLKTNHNGPSEIGTLFLDPEERGGPWGRFLSLSRFLFIACYSECFEEDVIAEMRGHIDENNNSVFWEALGKHFFDMEFQQADRLSMKNKHFIAELMPTHPIYVPLLPSSAQQVIGKVHPNTEPALKLLQKEGFKAINEVDIFEAGPVVSCKKNEIRSVKDSKVGEYVGSFEPTAEDPPMMIAKFSDFQNFCVALGQVRESPQGIEISNSTIKTLQLSPGEKLRYIPLRH